MSGVTTAGGRAVVAWSARIHSEDSDRHTWAVTVAVLLDEHGLDVELPPFPSRMRSTRESRDETVRRIYRRETLR